MIKREFFPLSEVLYYGIGGSARYLLEASSGEDVLRALDFVRQNGVERVVVAGLGSNLLFPDGLFDGAVLRIVSSASDSLAEPEPGLLVSFAGEELDAAIKFGFDRHLAGLEWAGGLPGTAGAGVRGNVGAFGGELKDVLEWAEVLETGDGDLHVRRLANRELNFSYRSSLVKQQGNMIVLSAAFRLQAVDDDALREARRRYAANIEYRHTNHPMEYPTCGSVFKNIARKDQVEAVLSVWPDVEEMVAGRWHGKVSMGYIINRLGLAGQRLGGAQISTKHNNFIVNLGDASFADVSGLIEMVRDRATHTFGFAPEPEVEIVGRNR